MHMSLFFISYTWNLHPLKSKTAFLKKTTLEIEIWNPMWSMIDFPFAPSPLCLMFPHHFAFYASSWSSFVILSVLDQSLQNLTAPCTAKTLLSTESALCKFYEMVKINRDNFTSDHSPSSFAEESMPGNTASLHFSHFGGYPGKWRLDSFFLSGVWKSVL